MKNTKDLNASLVTLHVVSLLLLDGAGLGHDDLRALVVALALRARLAREAVRARDHGRDVAVLGALLAQGDDGIGSSGRLRG